MDSSGFWDQANSSNNNNNQNNRTNSDQFYNSSSIGAIATSSQHQLQTQETIPQEELIDSIASASYSEQNNYIDEDDGEQPDDMGTNVASNVTSTTDQPTLEQIQRVYYTKGLEELDSLQLLDLSPLANWKISSYKQGFGLTQLRDDSPDTYWQSDGSNGNNNSNNNAITNNQLSNPHSITIQFSKKVSLERISIFTNFSLDESYTPSRIKIMAGSSDGWDLSEVCTINFNKPIGWSHIIFTGIRNDGVLKCFMVKLIILANHQDGKDSHIRAIRCFGKKPTMSKKLPIHLNSPHSVLKDLSLASGLSNVSGLSLNNQHVQNITDKDEHVEEYDEAGIDQTVDNDHSFEETNKILENVAGVIGFNSGFQSLELKSTSSIR